MLGQPTGIELETKETQRAPKIAFIQAGSSDLKGLQTLSLA